MNYLNRFYIRILLFLFVYVSGKLRLAHIRYLFFCVLLFSAFIFLGCGGKNLPPRPDGLPALYPCAITATFGGVAKQDVRVVLLPKSGNDKWKPSGITNPEGYVELSTSYGFKGAPAGTYTVTFSLIHEPDEEEIRRGTPKTSLIPLKYSPSKSTETVEVKPGKNNFTFDLDAGEEPIPK
ncbi:MAG: hypothetical protein LBP59_04290 [Planctomycetaceae bacterium]|jgi:hypothetical protein|nr:hypothetical protein [Planctomycetaceae bacterium]